MTILESGDDRHDGGGLGGVAIETANFQREAGAVDEQAHDDLRIDAAFLGVADLTQVVFGFGLEIQRGHVVQRRLNPPRLVA